MLSADNDAQGGSSPAAAASPTANAGGYAAAEAAPPPLAPPAVAVAAPAQEEPPAAAEAAEAAAPGEGAADGDEPEGGWLPDPEPAPGVAASGLGALKAKVMEKAAPALEKLSESEKVQRAKELAQSTAKKIAENERVQQGVEYAKNKTKEIAESERVQKGVEFAKEKSKLVAEKATQGLEQAKEKAKAGREAMGGVWSKGRGSITKVRANVGQMAWRGSARETLDMAARQEQWQDIKVQGAEELTVPARTAHTCAFHVSKGSTLRWTFRVKDHDVGFGVRMRVQEWGGSREDEVLAVERYDSADTISGSWVADEDRTMVLAFDNSYSKLRGKTVAYIVGVEKPPVFTEALVQEPAAGAAEAAPGAPIV